MSEMQRGMWLEEQLAPGTLANHISASLRISSSVDVDRFGRAVEQLVDLNPLLRSRVVNVDGSPQQIVLPDGPVSFEYIEATDWSSALVEDRLRAHHSREFDLEREPPIRFLLLRQADESLVFAVAAHHLAADLWSLLLVWEEIRRLYEDGVINGRPNRTTDYADFVRMETEIVADAGLANDHYRDRFARWTAQEVEGIDTSSVVNGLAATYPIALTDDEVAQAGRAARELGVSLRSLVLASFQTVIHRNAHLEHVVVGEVKANRSARFAALVGCCANVVPRFAEFAECRTLRDLVQAVDSADREDRRFDRIPFRVLARNLCPEIGALAFFSAMFAWQRSARIFDESTTTALAFGLDGHPVDSGTFRVSPVAMPLRSATAPLTLLGGRGSSGLVLALEYQLEAVSLTHVELLARELRVVLQTCSTDPDTVIADLDLRPESERQRDAAAWRSAVRVLDEDITALDLIQAQVEARADDVAVIDRTSSITYGELGERSDRLARRLRSGGSTSGGLVGIALDRTVDMVVAILGAWKCGMGYVPMDPGFPPDRLAIMVEDADLTTVIVSSQVMSDLAAAGEDEPGRLLDGLSVVDVGGLDLESDAPDEVARRPAGHDLAYVIFTSGSTGRPKGVAVEHRNVANFLRSMAVRPGLTDADVMVATTTLSFDISVLELLLPLTVGARVLVVDRDIAVDPARLASVLDQATVAQGTPAMWKMLVDSGWTCDPHFKILCGGEALPRDLGRALVDRSTSVWNMYGPTETTVWSAVGPVQEIDDELPFVPIGDPIDNTRLYVLDGECPAPDGVAGELWIGGTGVARGYLTSHEMTTDRFRPDPFFGTGERMYRTGDIVRRESNGTLNFLGRADGQIKLRGHRIELGEIESVLTRHEQIDQAVVVVRDFGEGDQRLVGYVTAERTVAARHGVDVASVREHSRGLLPSYMVPAAIVELEQFPFTPNNKIDRNALPHPGAPSTRQGPAELVASPNLEVVLQTYRDVLADDGILADADFFDLGGHSLLATRICSRLRRDLDSDVSVRDVFEHPTPRLLSRMVDRQVGTARVADEVPLGASDSSGASAMSFSQERMLFLHELNPSDTSYNLAGAVRIDGMFDLAAFRRACSALVVRHTGLRTTFDFIDGEPELEVHAPFDVGVSVIDWRETEDDDPMDAAIARLGEGARIPFDLRNLALFRIEVHVLSDDAHLVGIVMHHIISDQWSLGVLAAELGVFYEAETTGDVAEFGDDVVRPELYARWHRDQLTDELLADHLSYWREQLCDLPTVEYPTDRPRPSSRAGAQGGSVSMELSGPLLDGVRELSSSEQATEFMTLFAAFASVIHRATGADDIPIGVPIANRHRLESEGLITSLVNTLVIRADLSGDPSFRELVGRVRETSLDAYAHQDMPFERLVLELSPRRDTRRSPLFQYFFNVQNAPFELPDFGGLQVQVQPVPSAGAQFDISMTVDLELTRTVTVNYSTDLFDEATMKTLLESYTGLLEAAVAGLPSPIEHPVVNAPDVDDSRPDRGECAPREHSSRSDPPRPGTEHQVAAIWEAVLGRSGISRHDDFFDLGGYSLLAIRIFNEIERQTGRRPPMTTLFDAPTVAEFAALLDSGGWLSPWTSLVRVRGDGSRTPVFYVAPFLISALSFRDLARDITEGVPFYVLQPQGLEDDLPVHDCVEDMAAHYISELKTVQPHGPYVIGGHCAGAWVAFEMVRQLEAAGERVDRLVVVDVAPPGITPPKVSLLRYVWSRVGLYGRSGRVFDAIRWNLGLRVQRLRNYSTAHDDVRRAQLVRRRHADAHDRYLGGSVQCDLAFIRSEEWASLADKDWHGDWARLTSGSTTTAVVPGTHAGLLTGASESALAAVLSAAIEAR